MALLNTKRPSTEKDKLHKDMVTPKNTARLNADIDKSLYKKIKVRCAEEERSISEITKQLWIDYLK
jgi:hypothetical protein